MVGSHSSGSRSTADSYTSTAESSAPPMPSRILKEIEKNELDSQKEMNELKSQIAQLQNLIMKNQDMLNQMILCSQMYMQHFRPPGHREIQMADVTLREIHLLYLHYLNRGLTNPRRCILREQTLPRSDLHLSSRRYRRWHQVMWGSR